MNISLEFGLLLATNIVGIGVLVGTIKSNLADIKEEILSIKKDVHSQEEDIANIRERLAVIEFKIGIKHVSCILFLLMISSCSFTKKVKTKEDIRTSVNKNDTGSISVKKNEKTSLEDWWKEAIYFPQPIKQGGDTIINNYYPQPIKIIREGGTRAETEKGFDSSSYWRNKYDSLSVVKKESDKKVDNHPDYLTLAIGAAILYFILNFLQSKIKISLK